MDMSKYEGENNVQWVQMKGREEVNGIYKGMANIPDSWGAIESLMVSTKVDESSFEKMMSTGIAIKNTRNCFMLESVL